MWLLTRWATRSNEQAVRSARAAATAMSRRRVEAEDAEVFLAELPEQRRHPPDPRWSAGYRAHH
jgi:hypothetical protein